MDYSDIAIGADSKAEAVTVYVAPLIAKGLLKSEVPGDAIAIKNFGSCAMTNTCWTENRIPERRPTRRQLSPCRTRYP